MKKTDVIITAAGQGLRMNTKTKKQFILLNGKPILYYSINSFVQNNNINNILITLPKKNIRFVKKNIIEKYFRNKNIFLIPGGETRHHSIFKAIQHIVEDFPDFILIHDGVRPLVTNKLINNIINHLKKYKAVIPGLKITDTIKMVTPNNVIKHTVNRDLLRGVQTPQGFRFSIIRQAYFDNKNNLDKFTDDASLIENNLKVKIIDGDKNNIKLTTPDDLEIIKYFINNNL